MACGFPEAGRQIILFMEKLGSFNDNFSIIAVSLKAIFHSFKHIVI